MTRETMTTEAWIHAIIHFLGVVFLYWLVIVPPVWIGLAGIAIELAQIKLLGNCISTVIAHKRGIMVGMSYWEYVPYMLGVKDYKQVKQMIDYTIKITIAAILVFRLVRMI